MYPSARSMRAFEARFFHPSPAFGSPLGPKFGGVGGLGRAGKEEILPKTMPLGLAGAEAGAAEREGDIR